MTPVFSILRKIPVIMSIYIISISIGLPVQSAEIDQDSGDKPAKFIQGLANEAIAVLRDRQGSLDEREKRFRAVLKDNFAMAKIGRFAVGKFWRKMNTDQRQQYQQLFEKWILKTYSIRFGGYSDETVNVLKTIKAGQTDVLVRTKINSSSGRALKVDWRVRNLKGHFKIIDVLIEGVSMLVTQKAEFGAVLRQRGIDGLIEILRSQVDRLAAAKAS
jgi:phospholipid transport system substrate-binding protein